MALNAGSIEIKLFANVARLQADMNKANKTVDSAMRNIEKLSQIARRALGGVASAFSAMSLVRLADDFKRFDSQLQLATRNLNTYTEAFNNVVRISRIAQSDIGAVGVLYARLNNNLRDFNVTQSQVAGVTETISLALRANNATVQETNSVMLQLSQSFGSGKLNGQEFLAVAEGAPALLRQLANSLGVPFGALKDLSAQGKITREELLKAWTDPEYLAALRNQAKEVGTISSAMTVFTNNLKLFVGEQDKATGASNAIRNVIIGLADNINTLATVGIAALIVATGRWIAGTMASIQASIARQRQLAAEQIILERKARAEELAAIATQANTKATYGAAAAAATYNSNWAAFGAAQARATTGAGALRVAIGLLGGPIGAITTALGLGVTAWLAWGNQAKISADQAYAAVDRVNRGIASINDAKIIEMQRKQLEEEKRALTERKRILETFGNTERDIFGMGGENAQAMVQRQAQIEDYTRRIKELDDALAKHNTTQKENSVIITEADKAYERLVKANKVLSVEIEEQKAIVADAKRAYEANLITLSDYNKIVADSNKKIADMTGATKALKKEEKDRQKWLKEMVKEQEEFLKAQAKAREEQVDSIEKQNKSVEEEIKKLEEEIYTIKYGADAYNQLEISRLKDAAAIARQTIEQAKMNGASVDAIRYAEEYTVQLEKQIELKQKAKTLASEKAELEAAEKAVKANEKAAEKMEKTNDRLADSFSNALANSIMRGFERGKSFAYNFRDALIVAFKTLVLQPTIEFLINASGIKQLISSVLGAVGIGSTASSVANAASVAGSAASAAGGLGGITGIGDLLSVGSSIVDSIQNGLQGVQNSFANSIGSFGNFIASFSNSIDNGLAYQVGTWVSNNSQFISEVIPYAGSVIKLLQGDFKGAAFTAAGTAIGNKILPGIGGAIGGFLGNVVSGLFGGDEPKLFGNLARGKFTGGEFVKGKSELFGADLGARKAVESLNQAFGSALGKLLSQFDKDVEFSIQSIFRQRTNVRAWMKVNFGEGFQDIIAEKFNEGGFKAFANAVMGEGLVKAIKASGAPQGIKDIFSNILKEFEKDGKRAKASVALINTLGLLEESASGLNERFGLTVEQTAKVGNAVTQTTEELIQFLTGMAELGRESKTVGQAILDVKGKIGELFTEIGTTMPTSVEAFDVLMKNVNKNTDEGIKLFAQLMELRPKMVEFTNAIAELKNNVNSAIFDFLTPSERLNLVYGDLGRAFGVLNMEVPESLSALIEMGKAIDYTTEEGLTFAAAFPNLVNAYARAEQEAARALADANNRLATAKQNLLSAYDSERNRLQGVVDNVANIREQLNRAVEAQRASLQAIIDNVDTVKNKLGSAIAAERTRLENIINNIDNLKDALRSAFDTRASGLQETISRFKDFGKSIKDFRLSLIGRMSGTGTNALGSSRATFLQIAELAKAGDVEAMSKLTTVANEFLQTSENYSNNFSQYQSDFLEVNRILSEVENSSFKNADAAQQQLDLLERQVEAFIDLKRTVVSVEDAISNLVIAQQSVSSTQAEIERLNAIEAQYLGQVTESAQSIDQIIRELTAAQASAATAQASLDALNSQFLNDIQESNRSVESLMQELLEAQQDAAQALIRIAEINAATAALNNTEVVEDLQDAIDNYEDAINEQNNATSDLTDATQTALELAQEQARLEQERLAAEKAAAEAEAARLNEIAAREAELRESEKALIKLRKVGASDLLDLSDDTIIALAEAIEATDVRKFNNVKGGVTRDQLVTGFAELVNLSVEEISKLTSKQIEILAKLSGFAESDIRNAATTAGVPQFANGGVFTNGIVSAPTRFNMGMMGEAGSEAIMPLTSINGRLGVTTNNSDMVNELRVISEKISRLEAASVATAQHTSKVAKIIDRADNGDSINVTVVTE
jgi:tape measure domain-containing protein